MTRMFSSLLILVVKIKILKQIDSNNTFKDFYNHPKRVMAMVLIMTNKLTNLVL